MLRTIYRQYGSKEQTRNGHIKMYTTGTAIGLNLHLWQTRTSGNKIEELNNIITAWLEHHGFHIEQKKGRKRC